MDLYMKHLLFALLFFSLAHSQEQWPAETIKRNNVFSVSVYVEVPKTNPDYFVEPIGLMFISETQFDESGRIVKDSCRSCLFVSHGPSHDILEQYSYDEKGNLATMKKRSSDTINTTYSYFENRDRKLELTTDANGKRTGVTVVKTDDMKREIERSELDIRSVTAENHWVHILFEKREYSDRLKKEWLWREVFDIGESQLETLRTSFDVSELEKVLVGIQNNKRLDLSVTPNKPKVFSYNRDGYLKKISDNAREVQKFYYDKNGLLARSSLRLPQYKGTYKYIYKFRE